MYARWYGYLPRIALFSRETVSVNRLVGDNAQARSFCMAHLLHRCAAGRSNNSTRGGNDMTGASAALALLCAARCA